MLPLLLLNLAASVVAQDCPEYTEYASNRHPPFSPGIYEFPFQRPTEECRTHPVDEVERVINEDINSTISDPDLRRLFVNTWPNTVDTTVKWTGTAADNENEEVRSPWLSPATAR